MKIILVMLGVFAVPAIIWVVTVVPAFDPQLKPTYDGELQEYRGNKILVAAVYAHWAPLWKVTEAELAQIDPTEYDLALVNADRKMEALKSIGIELVPMVPRVVVIKNGKVLKTLRNMTSIAQLK
jgi:hypothetical protein